MRTFILCFLILSPSINVVHTQTILFRHWSGLCTFQGYKPGGNLPVISRITAPKASIQGKALRTISGKIGQGLTAEGNAANVVSKFSETFAKVAGTLAGTLVVFGDAFGEINSPTVGDILSATNRAIAQLSREVDNRLIQLKGYIDQQILNSEHQLMKNRYKSLFQAWANCINRPDPGAAERCERNAVAAIRAQRHFFMPSFANVMAGRILSHLSIKKLEINFIPYRDYVVLNLMSIQTLMNRYLGKPYYRGYRAQLIEDANRDITYAQKAYNAIKDMTYSRSFAHCGRTFRCPPYHTTHNWIWFIKRQEYRYSNCNCQINPLDVRRCQVQVGFYFHYANLRIYSFKDSVLTSSARRKLNSKARSFIDNQSPAVYNYYHNEVLDLILTWGSMINKSILFGSGSRWVPVPSWGGLRNISTGKAGVWGTIDGHVYVRVGITNTKIYATSGTYWKFIGYGYKSVSSGKTVAWGVTTANRLKVRKGISNSEPGGTLWQNVAGNIEFSQVSVSSTTNSVWATTPGAHLYQRLGITSSNPIGTSWHRVHLGFRYVANGDSGVWCINRINDVWYRNGTRVRDDKRIDGTSDWTHVQGLKFKQISSGHNFVWGVTHAGEIYVRLGISDSAPQGTSWKRISGGLTGVSINSNDGSVWGVSGVAIYFRNAATRVI